MRKERRRGSVLVEGVLSLGLVIPTLAFNLEAIRLSQFHVLAQHWSFLYVRGRVVGLSETAARRQFGRLAALELGESRAHHLEKIIATEIRRASDGDWVGRLRFRYSTEWPVVQSRFQVTRTCRFSS